MVNLVWTHNQIRHIFQYVHKKGFLYFALYIVRCAEYHFHKLENLPRDKTYYVNHHDHNLATHFQQQTLYTNWRFYIWCIGRWTSNETSCVHESCARCRLDQIDLLQSRKGILNIAVIYLNAILLWFIGNDEFLIRRSEFFVSNYCLNIQRFQAGGDWK